MAKLFGVSEHNTLNMFQVGTRFYYGRDEYTVIKSGKPTCRKGEPKTDIFIGARSDRHRIKEFKISFKKSNADFLENKTNAERAEQLFGEDWENIIATATNNLSREFASRMLIYKSGYGRTEAGAITLGWKFELLNVESGQLSGDMHLTRDQVIDVYSGTNLVGDKRNATVDGETIEDSGISNFILFEDRPVRNAQEAIDALITVEEYVDLNPRVYFACKALNYRTFARKYDGNRPLAVYVDWFARNGRLDYMLRYDTPLLQGGDAVYNHLHSAMRELNIETTDDLNHNNVADPRIILE